jgi:predicted RNA-binding Zn ribbon-like protein
MNLIDKPAGQMALIGGNLSLDFANAKDKLENFDDILAFALNAGIFNEAEAKRLRQNSTKKVAEISAVFNRAVLLNEAIRNICLAIINQSAPSFSAIETLNREISRARDFEMFVYAEKKFRREWQKTENSFDSLLWEISMAAKELLLEGDYARLRECCGDGCGWLFLDTSKNGRRTWCDMKTCGNVAKVRRFRAKPPK